MILKNEAKLTGKGIVLFFHWYKKLTQDAKKAAKFLAAFFLIFVFSITSANMYIVFRVLKVSP